MAIAYHRDQAGAPALVYNTTSGANAHFTALKTILKACLVTGYGSQAAAGWALIAEGTNYIVLRNGTHSGYVCLSWVTGGAVRVWLAETFTGMSGDVMTGAGLKTGTAANNATPQAIGASYVAYSDAATAWKLVADSKTFVINNLSGPSASSASAVTGGNGQLLYVGEDTAGGFIAVGGNSNTSANGAFYQLEFEGSLGFTSLKNPATGLLVGLGSLAVMTPGPLMTTIRNSPVGAFDSADLVRQPWFGGGVLAGRLRGIALTPCLNDARGASEMAQCLGFPAVMSYRDSATPIDLGDGHAYFVRGGHLNCAPFLLTDNPAFW